MICHPSTVTVSQPVAAKLRSCGVAAGVEVLPTLRC